MSVSIELSYELASLGGISPDEPIIVAGGLPQGLIGVSSQTDRFYNLSVVNGSASYILGSDRNVSLSGLAILGGTLYASDVVAAGGGAFYTVSVDPFLGASTNVSAQGGSSNWQGLAANNVAGVLYAVDTDLGRNLWTLTPGGTATVVGQTSIDVRSLAYDDASGILYATHSPFAGGTVQLYRIDTATGAATLIGNTGIAAPSFGSRTGLAYDEQREVLYMVNDADGAGAAVSQLYSLNLSTGAASLIGSTGINLLDGLEWNGTEPTGPSLVLAGTGGGDTLPGGYSADTLRGNGGNDVLNGGALSDVYIYAPGDGSDTISDTGGVNDRILYEGSLADLAFLRVGQDMRLLAGGTVIMTVTGQFDGSGAIERLTTTEGTFNFFTGPADDAGLSLPAAPAGLTVNGTDGNDSLSGGDNRDTLTGGAGDDTLSGGTADDTYVIVPGSGHDIITDSGGFTDTLRYEGLPSAASFTRSGDDLTFNLADGSSVTIVGHYAGQAIEFFSSSGVQYRLRPGLYTGGFASDVLLGDAGAETISGGDGGDYLDGGDGDDTLDGGFENDFLNGGAGDDLLRGGGLHDTLTGGAGNDTLDGGAGNDTLQGGAGNDSYLIEFDPAAGWPTPEFKWVDNATSAATGDVDTLSFASIFVANLRLARVGDDLAISDANSGNSVMLTGWYGPDAALVRQLQIATFDLPAMRLLDATAGSGGSAAEFVIGSAGADVLEGGGGNDRLDGFGGNDTLRGGSGNDLYIGRSGGAIIVSDSAGSDDRIVFDSISADWNIRRGGNDLRITSRNIDASPEFDLTISGQYSGQLVEWIELGSGRTLRLSTVLVGGTDADLLVGSSSSAILMGNDGSDVLVGGGGNDTAQGGAGEDTYIYSPGDGDLIIVESGSGEDRIEFRGPGASLTFSRIGDDLLVEVAGGGSITVAGHFAGATVEVLSASDSIWWLPSGLNGTGANDLIFGTAAAETLNGGNGSDLLVGGGGDDTLLGSVQNDIYGYELGDGADRITDTSGTDQIQYLGSAADWRVSRAGSDLLIQFPDSGSITVVGLTAVEYVGSDSDGLFRLRTTDTSDVGQDLMVGSAASESLNGNGGNDLLFGGAGNDSLRGGAGNDRIDGGDGGTDAALFAGPRSSYSIARSGNTVIITDLDGEAGGLDDGTDTLIGIERLSFNGTVVSAYVHVSGDFGGDGKADLFWSSGGGASLAQWHMSGNTYVGGGVFSGAPNDWTIAGLADFSGDGAADILWRHDSGALAQWHMNGTNYIGGGVLSGPGGDWTLGGIADFTGDGASDLLWRNSTGALAQWHMNGTQYVGGGVLSGPGGDWMHRATADFNGDGTADLLWQDGDALAMWFMDGTSYLGGGVLSGAPGWMLKAAADFNGDGRADLLWHDGGNGYAQWHMNGTGYSGGGVFAGPGAGWSIAGVSDFDADGRADILWAHGGGALALWEMNGTAVENSGLLGPKPDGWSLVTLGQLVA